MGVDLTDQSYVASDDFTLESLRQCFPNTKSGREVPLLQRRFEILKEDAKVLTSQYGGDIINLIAQCNNSALSLVQRVASEFPSFDDRARVNSKQTTFDVKADSARAQDGDMELIFRKRAQIFVAELAHEDPAKYQYPDLD